MKNDFYKKSAHLLISIRHLPFTTHHLPFKQALELNPPILPILRNIDVPEFIGEVNDFAEHWVLTPKFS
jgi:hypothetical protein